MKILYKRNLDLFALAFKDACYILTSSVPHIGPYRIERAGLLCLLVLRQGMKKRSCVDRSKRWRFDPDDQPPDLKA